MRIHVKADNVKFLLLLPTSLVFSGVSATLVAHHAKKEGETRISARDMRRLFKEIRRARKNHRKLTIVEVDADDAHVKIRW